MNRPVFDELSTAYEELLLDPIRERFTGGESAFFHRRKAEVIRAHFRRRGLSTSRMRYLDLGCGKGDLLRLLRPDFARAAGCDISLAMMKRILEDAPEIETRVQSDALQIPFDDAEFDFVTAVCVYHHVSFADRPALTQEIGRVLRPGGIFCLIEHNPFNPLTRLIVSRAPVDAGARLLPASESRRLAAGAGFLLEEQDYFLYCPQALYRYLGWMDAALAKVPLGGQYALFSAASGSGALRCPLYTGRRWRIKPSGDDLACT